ncbi:uncharacterized protein PG998_009358 [Apiospora kogelbergensis]|uniref:uncharacterized protein n=1 Tax=Apiospora kogelbergensis TaxID=1337665 RepID=UPI003131C599
MLRSIQPPWQNRLLAEDTTPHHIRLSNSLCCPTTDHSGTLGDTEHRPLRGSVPGVPGAMASSRAGRNDRFDALWTAEPEDTGSQIIGGGTHKTW